MKSNSTIVHLIFFIACVFEMATFIVSFPAESSVAIVSGLIFRKQLTLPNFENYGNILEYFLLVFSPFISLTRLLSLVS